MELSMIYQLAVIALLSTLQAVHAIPDETAVLYTVKGLDGTVGIRGIQGDPDDWVKNGIKNTFVSAPDQNSVLYRSFRLALSFRYADREVFFSDAYYKDIYMLPFEKNTTGHPFMYTKKLEVMYDGTSAMVFGLAVDWTSNVIYWTDALYNWVSMASIDRRQYYKHIVTTGLDIPFGIAVDPYNGHVYFTDYGARAKIERCNTDGTGRIVLIADNIKKPRGLTIDYTENMIYWVDDGKDTIEMSNLDGTNRKVMELKELNGPNQKRLYGIAVFKNYIFITDAVGLDIKIYNKENMTFIRREMTVFAQAYDIMVFDESIQAKPATLAPGVPLSSCEDLNCSQICINAGNGRYHCECGVGYELKSDRKSCQSKKHQMPQFIYTLGNQLCATPPNLPDTTDHPKAEDIYCFHKNLTSVEALAMDSYAELLFYSDTVDNEIVRIRMDLDADDYTEKEVIAVQTGDVKGIAVDYISSNLYWADKQYNHIMVSRLDGRYPAILINDAQQPRGLEIDAVNRTLYWSSVESIKSANLDGTDMKDYTTYKVYNPDGVVLDPVKHRFYWCNAQTVKTPANITHLDMDDHSIPLTLSAGSVTAGWTFRDVTVFQDYMAWTDGRGSVHFARNMLEPSSTPRRTVTHAEVDVSHDIITYDKYLQPLAPGPCDFDNGGCQHLCLPNPTDKTCMCAIGFSLHSDGLQCVSQTLQEEFLLFSDPYHRQFYQIDVSVPGSNSAPQGIPLDNLENPQFVEYDQETKKLYWIEALNSGSFLKRSDINGNNEELLLTLNSDNIIGGMAVYNNIVYYMSNGNIYSVSLRTGQMDLFYNGGNVFPRSLNVDRNAGRLFWLCKGSVQIYSADLCGSNSPQLLTTITEDIIIEGAAVTNHPSDKLAFWSKSTIWEVELNTGNYNEMLSNNSAWFYTGGYHGDILYMSQWNQKSVFGISNGMMEEITSPLFSRIISLKSYGKDADIRVACATTTTSTTTPQTTTTTSTTTPQTTTTTSTTTTTDQRPTTISTTTSTTSKTTQKIITPSTDHVETTEQESEPSSTTVRAFIGGSAPIHAKSSMEGKKVYIIAGTSVVAFGLIVLVLFVVWIKLRRRRKDKPATAVHYQPEAHDNPTYITHSDIANIPRATEQDLAPAIEATGVSFDPLPPKDSLNTATAVSTIEEPLDVSDKARLVEHEQRRSQFSDLRVLFEGNSNSVTYNLNGSDVVNPSST